MKTFERNSTEQKQNFPSFYLIVAKEGYVSVMEDPFFFGSNLIRKIQTVS
jgi:hypothetical protein